MASNHHDHGYDFIVNGHKFTSPDRIITGRKVLEITGLTPAEDYEILMKLTGKEFEPVELTEEKDLKNEGIEHFEVNPVKKLSISLDDEPYDAPKVFMTPVEILELAKMKPEQFYLKQIAGHKEISYKSDELHQIAIVCHMRFSSFKKGPATVSAKFPL